MLWCLPYAYAVGVGVVVLCGLFLHCRQHSVRKLLYALLVCAGVAAAVLFVFDKNSLLEWFNQALNLRTSLFNGCDKAWGLLWESFLQHPFLGVGFQASQKYVLIPGGFTNPYGSQNIYLRLLAESGFAGLLGFLCLVLTPLIRGFHLFFAQTGALSGERSMSQTGQALPVASGAQYSPSAAMRWEDQVKVLSLCLSVVSTFLLHVFFEDNLNPASALFMFPVVCLIGGAVLFQRPEL